MDPETRRLLEDNLELAKENNEMLKKMRKSMLVSMVVRSFYWIIIIGSAIGAYYAFQPFFENLWGVFDSISAQIKKLGDLGASFPDLNTLTGQSK